MRDTLKSLKHYEVMKENREELRNVIQDEYRIYEINPPNTEASTLSLWRVLDEERDIPILQNTGGMWILNARKRKPDNAIVPSGDFFDFIGHGYHYRITTSSSDIVEDLDQFAEMLGVEDMIQQEKVLGSVIIQELIKHQKVPYDLGPIVQYTKECTKWEVPEVDVPDVQDFNFGDSDS